LNKENGLNYFFDATQDFVQFIRLGKKKVFYPVIAGVNHPYKSDL